MTQQRITDAFVELADTLVDDYDVVDLLHTLAERSVELLDADAAGILLRDATERLSAVASTSHEADLVELFVVQSAEGPCLDCIRTGEAVVNIDIEEARRRWPHFVTKVAEIGFASTHAFPLRLRDEVLGAINLFSSEHLVLGEAELSVARGLADIATIGLLQQRAVRHHEVLAEELQTALNSRIVIEQAKGVLAERTGLAVAQSFVLLRDYSRRTQGLLLDTAEQVIAGTLGLDDLRGS